MNKWAFTIATQNRIGMWMIRVEDQNQDLICEVRAKTKEECIKNAASIVADQSLKRELVEALNIDHWNLQDEDTHEGRNEHMKRTNCTVCALIKRASESL